MPIDLKQLQQEISNFEIKQKKCNKQNESQKHSNISIIYNVFADLLGSIITAFILNKIYCYFFSKSNLVFAFLLIICSIAGLYNTIRYFLKK